MTDNELNLQSKRFFISQWLFWTVVILALTLGLGIRAYDLTDLPFDFHATRQTRAAIIARGLYYENLEHVPDWQRDSALESANKEAIIEPQVMEQLAAWLYHLVGGEYLWIPRLLSSLFWISAGVAVLLLGRDLATFDGGLVAMFYLLFLPYSIYATRTFQPDPLMTALFAWSILAVIRWYQIRSFRMAILAGIIGGLAIYVKSVAVFFVGGAFIGLILLGIGFRQALRDKQIWVMGFLTVLPMTLFYIFGLWIAGFLQQQLDYRFFPAMWRDPAFYIRWQEMATNISGFGTVLVALASIFMIADKGKRGLLGGLWLGYFAYSMTFPYHTLTHDYYQLPLILIVAISITVVASEFLSRIASVEKGNWVRAIVVLLLFAGAFFKVWDVRVNLIRTDYRGDAAFYEEVGEFIEPGARVLAMSQAYGHTLSYYGWVPNDPWIRPGDVNLRVLAGASEKDVLENSFDAINNYDYFVTTQIGELNNTPELKEILYSNYEVFAEGDGYIIFNLKR
ncbi:MAG: glycosyltransferase family 39 protein [Anaerolineales bacterium]|nr:glycosyltransferase family 39 protein [Chloroflexota bacterium]MBL6979842.1 glycosyltransferase family 39 protein [Anaerolineales bacterium]